MLFDMMDHARSIQSLTAPWSFLPPPPRRYRLSILLLTLTACFTSVTSQASKITITVSDEVTECVPTNITWYGGTPPYTVGVRVGSFDDEPEEVYTNISTTFFLWSTDVASNNFVVFAVGDNLTIANSDFIEIQAGLTQSCVPDALIPFTSTVGGGSHTTVTKTQGAPASGSPTGQPPSTSQSITSTTVTVSVTDSVGGTNPATPGTTNTSSASSSSHSSLSPDVIGIIVAVAVVLLIVVIWVFYKCLTRTKPVPAGTSTSIVSTPASAAGPVVPYLAPPTSPTVRATSILSASPNYSPVGSPSMSALQFAPYGYSPPAPLPPHALAPHPVWQGAGAAAVHTTQTQTYFVGSPATLASRAPSVLSGHHEPAGWSSNMQEAYVGQTQWLQETAPREQGRLAAIRDAREGPGVVSTEGGSDSWRAMLSPPQARRP
ncbi:hypothetical protein V8D89_001009 [Ganoderma adspersum]